MNFGNAAYFLSDFEVEVNTNYKVFPPGEDVSTMYWLAREEVSIALYQMVTHCMGYCSSQMEASLRSKSQHISPPAFSTGRDLTSQHALPVLHLFLHPPPLLRMYQCLFDVETRFDLRFGVIPDPQISELPSYCGSDIQPSVWCSSCGSDFTYSAVYFKLKWAANVSFDGKGYLPFLSSRNWVCQIK